ncbi:MAG: glycosidase [Lewinellaceae bacterium]|nr:glycosidase [Lewinellaceae bacterium]
MHPAFKELFHRYPTNPILSIEDWPYPANSVFNCGAARLKGETVLLIRVEDLRGMSHLTVARSQDGISHWVIDETPTFLPDPENYPEEIWGVEDPRITYIDQHEEYYFTYTAYSAGGPLVSLAKTKDFVTFERFGAILPPEDKDAALFPVCFHDRWALLHRPIITTPTSSAHIWISFSPDLIHWGEHRILLRSREGGWWDARKIGLSPPPIPTPEGWIILYHGVRQTGGGVIYRLGIALLALDDPTRVIRRSDEWIFGPREPYEREGDVDDVVFPCGWVLDGDELRIYYGGADTCIALATGKLSDILDYIRTCPQPKPEVGKRWG